ncbi:MAG: tRNA 2-thiouridine(34) synthase MnmA [Parcubacteria group bacterium RIFCSPHIGHO2_01_FULL_47_10b]|nr:MAG: tRNA 2-thiouridine(34) synthase MnmA [Parcubacteria group bacterium RIFCSPHIGHO2_01_FULL_47_10b]
MSGGVDSSVAAALLLREGYRVVGCYIRCWSDEATCAWREDQDDVRRVAQHLGIPFYTFNLEEEYYASVVEYMLDAYKQGITPNPDIMCNSAIKFGIFLDKARELGADFVATGHYAHIDGTYPRRRVYKGVDPGKDQTYFLWRLTQTQLRYAIFPVGKFQKSEVRALAKEMGLPVWNKKDSQGICFMGSVKVFDFLKEKIGMKIGDIVDESGKKLGSHYGVHLYTIGQRKGMGVGGGVPYYVARKNVATNTLVVAPITSTTLYKSTAEVSQVNIISPRTIKAPYTIQAKIRYQQPDQEATITALDRRKKRLTIEFAEPQRAISPGQSLVLYRDTELMGGGIIDK